LGGFPLSFFNKKESLAKKSFFMVVGYFFLDYDTKSAESLAGNSVVEKLF